MSFLQFVACCLTVFDVSEGRLVQGIIGQNVSITWNLNNIGKDAIRIMHDNSVFLQVWPVNDYFELRKHSDQIMIAVEKSANGTLMLTVHFLNITGNNAGMYKVTKLWNAEELVDSVLLEVLETNRYSSTTQNMKEDAEETREIIYYSTTAMSEKEVTDDFPSKTHLLYIVLGMGTILAVAFLACLLHKVRVCLRAGRLSKINTTIETNTDDRNENLQEESSQLNYWSIVDNERGELSTGIEIIVDQKREPQSIGQINIKYNHEPDGYLNPIQSHSVEFDKYIHPVYVHTGNKDFESIDIV